MPIILGEMKIKRIRWGTAIVGGWFVILVAAAIVLTPIDSKRVAWSALPLTALMVIWLLLTSGALLVYFYRGWRRVPLVSNKTPYALWLSFETICALALVSGLIWLFVPRYSTSPRESRERILRQDLLTMRALISQYTIDNQKRPGSLDDLVMAGYLKELPIDPTTGRRDTWIVKCSNNPSNPSIESVESGHSSVDKQGTRCGR